MPRMADGAVWWLMFVPMIESAPRLSRPPMHWGGVPLGTPAGKAGRDEDIEDEGEDAPGGRQVETRHQSRERRLQPFTDGQSHRYVFVC